MFVIFFPCQFLLIFLDLIDVKQSDLPVNLIKLHELQYMHTWSVCTSIVHI